MIIDAEDLLKIIEKFQKDNSSMNAEMREELFQLYGKIARLDERFTSMKKELEALSAKTERDDGTVSNLHFHIDSWNEFWKKAIK